MVSSDDDEETKAAHGHGRNGWRLLVMPRFPQLPVSGHCMRVCRCRENRDLDQASAGRKPDTPADPRLTSSFVRARIGLNPERNVIHTYPHPSGWVEERI